MRSLERIVKQWLHSPVHTWLICHWVQAARTLDFAALAAAPDIANKSTRKVQRILKSVRMEKWQKSEILGVDDTSPFFGAPRLPSLQSLEAPVGDWVWEARSSLSRHPTLNSVVLRHVSSWLPCSEAVSAVQSLYTCCHVCALSVQCPAVFCQSLLAPCMSPWSRYSTTATAFHRASLSCCTAVEGHV
jgi:hypothetical protein